MTRLFLIILCMWPQMVLAQSEPVECRILSAHQPRSDVHFVPGQDVKGRPVVPADINSVPMTVPEVITAPLTVDMASRLQNMSVPAGIDMKSPLGFLEIYKNGRVVYDGRDITSQAYALCGISSAVHPVSTASSGDMAKEVPALDAKPLEAEPPEPVDARAENSEDVVIIPPEPRKMRYSRKELEP
ncbi:MAG: hypothetical protein J0L77_05420 [Alphaproteobacteria bacterium]|nr:hypothetical protein [Alphaproteobacteria bacterium]